MTTYPIVAPTEGTKLDPTWGGDVTAALNDHETRISSVETQYNPQVAYTTNGVMASSSGSEVAMTAWTGGASPTFVFKAGWVHELSIQGAVDDSGTGGTAGRIIARVRKGLNTTSGQQLALIYAISRGGGIVISTSAIDRKSVV